MRIMVTDQQGAARVSRPALRRLAAWLLMQATGGAGGGRTPPGSRLAGRPPSKPRVAAGQVLGGRASREPRGPAGPAPEFHKLEILLTDDAGMAAVNQAVFGRRDVTDVISQAYAPVPGENGTRAELALNVALAVREGARRRGGPARELALYLAHGCDHLAGACDAAPRGRAAMRRRELHWLRQLAARGLLTGLITPRSSKPSSPRRLHAEPCTPTPEP